MTKNRRIISIATKGNKVFAADTSDTERTVVSITMKTSPIAGVCTEVVSYIVKFAPDMVMPQANLGAKKNAWVVIPGSSVSYIEYEEAVDGAEEKPIELRIAPDTIDFAGESNG